MMRCAGSAAMRRLERAEESAGKAEDAGYGEIAVGFRRIAEKFREADKVWACVTNWNQTCVGVRADHSKMLDEANENTARVRIKAHFARTIGRQIRRIGGKLPKIP